MADQQKVTRAMLRAGGKAVLRDRGCHRQGAKPTREDYRLALAVYQAMERVRADGVLASEAHTFPQHTPMPKR